MLDRGPIDCIGQQLPQIKFCLSGQWCKWGVSSPQIDGATAEAVREEGGDKQRDCAHFHFCSGKHETLLLLPNNCAQGKASMRPVIISLKNTIGGQIDLIKVAGAPVPTHRVSCLKHRAFGHVPEAVK